MIFSTQSLLLRFSMRKLFIKLDLFLEHKSKRERIILFLLPIVLFLGFLFGFVMPYVDEIYEKNKAFLNEQNKLFTTLNGANNKDSQNLKTSLESKEKFLKELKSKRITNQNLSKALESFGGKILHISDSNLSFYATGDADLLEDILEEIEKNYFVFIKDISLNAQFSTDLEMKFDVVNIGESF